MKRLLSVILVVAILFSLAACSQKAGATWQEQYDLGVRYLNEGKYEEAVIAFNAAIEIDPKQADAYIGLADVYAAQGDTEKAVEILEKAVAEIGETEELTAAMAGLAPAPEPTPEPAPAETYTERVDNEDGSYYIYEYSPDGRMLSYTYYDASGWYCTGAFDEYGRNLYDIFYNADGSFDKRREFEYDERGNVIWERNYDESGNLLYSVQYEYDEYGNVVRIIEYDADGNIESIEEMDNYYGDLVGAEVYAEVVEGTLEISDLSVFFAPGEDENNPGSVGSMEYSFMLHGPEGTAAVRIATWAEGEVTRSEIDSIIKRSQEAWADIDMSFLNGSLPRAEWNSRPVDEYELGNTNEVMFVGVDKNGNATGYVLIREQLPSFDELSSGMTTPGDLPSIGELTFFGRSPFGLDARQMQDIAEANGCRIDTNEDHENADYYWFFADPDHSSDGAYVTVTQYDTEATWSIISYNHYYEFTDATPMDIGLRNIRTRDSMSTVFAKLGIPDGDYMAQRVADICAEYTYDEALNKLWEESESLSCSDKGEKAFFYMNTDGWGDEDENGVYRLVGISAGIDYYTDDAGYYISFEFAYGLLTNVEIHRSAY